MWAALAVGIFATPLINSLITGGLVAGNVAQIGIQALAIGVVALYTVVVTFIIGKLIDRFIGLRVEDAHEVQGLDLNLHEESGYRLS